MSIKHQFNVRAPPLTTERLSLDPHRPQDFADLADMWADPEVVRYIGGRPFTPEEVWTRLLRAAGHWPLMGFGYWIVRERSTGRFVGEAGLADLRRDISPGFCGAPEAGWALSPWAHGQGYGGEAVAAVLAWSDAELKPERVVCIISPDNEPSIRLARRCGFTLLHRASYRGEPTLVFERRTAEASDTGSSTTKPSS